MPKNAFVMPLELPVSRLESPRANAVVFLVGRSTVEQQYLRSISTCEYKRRKKSKYYLLVFISSSELLKMEAVLLAIDFTVLYENPRFL